MYAFCAGVGLGPCCRWNVFGEPGMLVAGGVLSASTVDAMDDELLAALDFFFPKPKLAFPFSPNFCDMDVLRFRLDPSSEMLVRSLFLSSWSRLFRRSRSTFGCSPSDNSDSDMTLELSERPLVCSGAELLLADPRGLRPNAAFNLSLWRSARTLEASSSPFLVEEDRP